MLFCAIARNALQPGANSGEIRHVALDGGWWLTFAGDSVAEQPGSAGPGLVATESHRQLPLLQARFDSSNPNALEIEKFLVSCRPAYYHLNARGEFYFSTHVQLLRRVGIPLEEDREALPEFFVYLAVAPPRTMFKGIRQIPTWGRLRVRRSSEGCTLEGSEYCQPLEYHKLPAPPETEVSARAVELIRAGIARFGFRSDTVAGLLSGGMDSTVLCKVLADDGVLRESWSATYPLESESQDLERPYAATAAAELGTAHHCFQPTVEAYLNGMIDAIAAAEMPMAHLQSVLLGLIFDDGLPRPRTDVVCGEAASVFGPTINMPLFRAQQSPLFRFLSSPPGWAMLRMVGPFGGRRAAGFCAGVKKISGRHLPIGHPGNPIWSFGARGSAKWAADAMGFTAEQVIAGRYASLRNAEHLPLMDLTWFYNLAYALNDTVLGWSALAGAHGRALCVPFLYQPLIDYVGALPWTLRSRLHKYVLLIAGKRLGVSDTILYRPKLSFGLDPARWAAPGTLFEPLVPLVSGVVPESEVRRIRAGGYNSAMSFWAVLNYAIWKQIWIQGADPRDLKAHLAEALGSRFADHAKI